MHGRWRHLIRFLYIYHSIALAPWCDTVTALLIVAVSSKLQRYYYHQYRRGIPRMLFHRDSYAMTYNSSVPIRVGADSISTKRRWGPGHVRGIMYNMYSFEKRLRMIASVLGRDELMTSTSCTGGYTCSQPKRFFSTPYDPCSQVCVVTKVCI